MRSRPPRAHALIGKIVAGRYRVVQLLASGGIGDVLVAEPMTIRETPKSPARSPGKADPRGRVAVKALREEHRERPEIAARFRREAEAAARVRHGGVIAVIEPPTEAAGVLCFVTELLVGLDLADTLAFSGALGPARAMKIARGVAEALVAAHAAGVIHRDVKPENIFLVHEADGREAIKLIDFGLAFVPGDDPSPARPVGTPGYMAPEEAAGGPVTPQGDVYSLGVVIHEMLAGAAPWSETPAAPLRARAAISDELESVVVQALAEDPLARFGSMRALLRALLSTPEAEGSCDPRRG